VHRGGRSVDHRIGEDDREEDPQAEPPTASNILSQGIDSLVIAST
jgi:hypothetical protein